MQYLIHFGVQVDVQIPEEDQRMLREQWEAWKSGRAGEDGCYTSIQEINLLTRYEHFALGSGVGLPPDPFKPLALQHERANLEEVIEARRRVLPPTEEYQGSIYPLLVPDFELLTGLKHLAEVTLRLHDRISMNKGELLSLKYNRGTNYLILFVIANLIDF